MTARKKKVIMSLIATPVVLIAGLCIGMYPQWSSFREQERMEESARMAAHELSSQICYRYVSVHQVGNSVVIAGFVESSVKMKNIERLVSVVEQESGVKAANLVRVDAVLIRNIKKSDKE